MSTGGNDNGGGAVKKTPKKSTVASGVKPPSAADLLASFKGQAAGIYAPQFSFLDQEGSNLKNQYGAGDSKLQQLYANLVQSINGDAKAITGNYNGAINQNTAQTKQGLGQIDGIYNSSQAREAALLQSLGIQAAAPDVLAQGTRDRGNYESALATNGAAYGNQLNSERASSLAFNKQAATISKEQGTEKRAGLQSKLQDALTQLAGQRAQLQSQQASKALDLQSSAASSAYSQQKDQADRDLALTKLQLQYGQGSAAAGKTAALSGPTGALATEAAKLYPTGGAQNAIKAITDTMETYGSETPRSVNDFVTAVLKRNPHATDVAQLTDLAQLLFKQLGFSNPTPY